MYVKRCEGGTRSSTPPGASKTVSGRDKAKQHKNFFLLYLQLLYLQLLYLLTIVIFTIIIFTIMYIIPLGS
jgi:hypothetical protein